MNGPKHTLSANNNLVKIFWQAGLFPNYHLLIWQHVSVLSATTKKRDFFWYISFICYHPSNSPIGLAVGSKSSSIQLFVYYSLVFQNIFHINTLGQNSQEPQYLNQLIQINTNQSDGRLSTGIQLLPPKIHGYTKDICLCLYPFTFPSSHPYLCIFNYISISLNKK